MIRACLCMLAGMYVLQTARVAAVSDLISITLVATIVLVRCRALSGLFWVLTGLAIFAVHASGVIDSRLKRDYAGDSMVGTVRIVDFPNVRDSTVTFTAIRVGNPRLPFRMRISWYEPGASLNIGDVWQFELRLRRPRGLSNPGVFDLEAWLLRHRIGATGYVVAGSRNQLLSWDDLAPVDRVRRHIVDRLLEELHDRQNAAVLAAISVGARHLMTSDQWQRYANTGTSHLMAISGLHVGLVSAGGYLVGWLVSVLLRPRGGHKRAAAHAALFAAVTFASLSGLAVTSKRAALMIGLVGLSTIRARQPRPWRALTAAAIVVMVLQPLETMAPGFKLSFAAVAILLWVARRPLPLPRSRGSPTDALRGLGHVQICLLLGLMPLTASIFGRAVLSAPAVNLVVLPLFSFVTVPFTLIGLLLDGPVQSLGNIGLQLASGSLRGIDWILERASQIPGAVGNVASLEGWSGLLLLLPLVWVLLPSGWPGRRLAWLGLTALLLYQPPRLPSACAGITLLDVGHGLAIVVQTRRHILLYDTGPAFRGGGSIAETVILPFLRSRGIDRIDDLIVSHADLDHAGGLAKILAELPVERLVTGEPLPGTGKFAEYCQAGNQWSVDGIDVQILHPGPSPEFDGNNASCVVLIAAGSYSLLITGDIERNAESELLRHARPGSVDAVIIPHHGSLTSSSVPFVNALSPGLALVSAAYDNRWELPKTEVVQRWKQRGATVLNTATAGAIRLSMCSDSGIVMDRGFRHEHRRIWTD